MFKLSQWQRSLATLWVTNHFVYAANISHDHTSVAGQLYFLLCISSDASFHINHMSRLYCQKQPRESVYWNKSTTQMSGVPHAQLLHEAPVWHLLTKTQIKSRQSKVRIIYSYVMRCMSALYYAVIIVWLTAQSSSRENLQCESKQITPLRLLSIFAKRLGILNWNFAHLLCVQIYNRLPNFIQLSPHFTKLCCIKRDYPPNFIISNTFIASFTNWR